jgi:hypothetical protein
LDVHLLSCILFMNIFKPAVLNHIC